MSQTPTGDKLSFLPRGEAGDLIRNHDWTCSGLGAPEQWPQSLKTVTSMLLISPVPIVLLWGVKGIMIYNDAYSVFAGSRHPHLLGSEVRKGWAEIADFNDNVMRVGLAGRTLAYKDQELTLHRHGRPEQVWMNLDYSPVLDESGEPAGVIAIVVETTQRVQADRNLQRSEQRFRALVNAAADVTYRLSPDWEDLHHLQGESTATPNVQATLGWLETFILPADRQRVSFIIEQAIQDKSTFDMEHQTMRADGTVGWILSRVVPICDDDGNLVEWFGAATDTTSRREAEETLRVNEKRLLFLDALGKETARSADADVIMAVTTQMLGEHLGVAVCAYADMEPDQDAFTIRGDWHAQDSSSIVGQYHLASFGQLALEKLRAGLPLILNDNAGQLPEHEAHTFLSIGLAATVCMPLVKENRLTALMAIHHNTPREWQPYELTLLAEVTERSWAHIERVRAEVQRRRSEERFRNDLESQVQERTEALRVSEANIRRTEQALHQAQKMDALGKLTGGIAHDFNNLLTAIIGSLELLSRRMPPSPPLKRLLDNARTGAQRGASLVARMLAFARQQELQMQPVELCDLVTGMSELLQRSLGPTVELSITLTGEPAWVSSDPNQLESALLNLAVNARDAMHGQGTISIAIDLQTVAISDSRLKAGNYWRIRVTDTGEGMDEDTLRRAVEPFFTTKGIGQGTGLGLSMVHGVVEQSGGALRLKSQLGQGTTLELWLPQIECPAGPCSDRVDDSDVELTSLPPLKILVVDDDPLVLINTVEVLRDMGHHVCSASGGNEALDLLDQQPFDIVVTDHAMPSMTGAQLIASMQGRHPEVRSILVSGYAEIAPGQIPEVPRLSKPYSRQQLLELVDAVARNSTGPVT